jgi:hypothetical protein
MYITCRYSHFNILFSSLCHSQCGLLASLGVHCLLSHLLTFHILIFTSETHQPNELKLSRKHLWKVLSKECTFCYDHFPCMATTGNTCFWLANLKKSPPLKLLGQINRNWYEASMKCPLWRLLISSRSVNKHGYHRQFLFLIGRYIKKSSPMKLPSQMNRNLVESIYMHGRFSIKFSQSRVKGEQHRLSPLSL